MSSGGYAISVCNKPTRSTQPCIPPGSPNRVPASAEVRAGMSPLPGDPMWHVSCRSGVATLRTAIHLLLTYSSDHSTDAGRSTSSGASGRYGPKGGCCYRPATQTEGRTDTRPLHRRLLHAMRPASKMRPVAADGVAWYVCVCVRRSRPRTLQRRLNRFRCRFGCGLVGYQETMRWIGARISPGERAL